MYCYNKPESVKITLYTKRSGVRIMSYCFENRVLVTLNALGALLSAAPWSWHTVYCFLMWSSVLIPEVGPIYL